MKYPQTHMASQCKALLKTPEDAHAQTHRHKLINTLVPSTAVLYLHSPLLPALTPSKKIYPMNACLPYHACLSNSDTDSRSGLAPSLLTHNHTPTVSQWPDFHRVRAQSRQQTNHRICKNLLVRKVCWLPFPLLSLSVLVGLSNRERSYNRGLKWQMNPTSKIQHNTAWVLCCGYTVWHLWLHL